MNSKTSTDKQHTGKRKLKGSEIICESLLREGADVIFGYPGGAILPFYDALWSYPQLRHILVRHESPPPTPPMGMPASPAKSACAWPHPVPALPTW